LCQGHGNIPTFVGQSISIIPQKDFVMTRRERAILDMADALDAELKESSSVYTGNAEFEEGVAAFRQKKKVADDAAVVAYPKELKFSEEKLAAKTELAIKLSILCGLAYVKLKKIKQMSLANSLSLRKSDYLFIADFECVTLAEAMHKLLLDNVALINIPSITTEVLDGLLIEIEAFKSLKGTSQIVRENSPLKIKAFRDSLPPLLDSVEDLQMLVGYYYEPKPDFYARIMTTSSIPTVHVFHTYITITAILKSTGKPAVGVVFGIGNSKKTATTDRDGVATFERVRSGQEVLTGMLNGKQVYCAGVRIKRSTTNHYEVVIEG